MKRAASKSTRKAPVKYEVWTQAAIDWLWDDFSPESLACPGTGEIVVCPHAMSCLVKLKTLWRKPLTITSAYRSKKYNRQVGGVENSFHTFGRAFDIAILSPSDADDFISCAKEAGFTGFGLYPKSRFIHIDTGPRRIWGDPFKPAPKKKLRESRTVLTSSVGWLGFLGEFFVLSSDKDGRFWLWHFLMERGYDKDFVVSMYYILDTLCLGAIAVALFVIVYLKCMDRLTDDEDVRKNG